MSRFNLDLLSVVYGPDVAERMASLMGRHQQHNTPAFVADGFKWFGRRFQDMMDLL